MISMAATAAPLARIEPPDQPLSVFPLLRTVVDNPIKAWPRAVYRDRLYRRRVFGQDAVYVMAPDLIRTVLLDDADSFEKGEIARRTLGPGLGDSILVADGSRWRWQRRAVAALFRPERIREFLPEMIAAAERTRGRWQTMAPGAEIDVAREMMRTTFDIILRTMLPGRGRIDTELMERSVTSGLESTSWIVALALVRAPSWVPYPGIYRTRRNRKRLHSILESLIIEARQTPGDGDDLLSHLTTVFGAQETAPGGRAIGAVSKHIFRCVSPVQKSIELAAVVYGRVGYRIAPDQLVRPVHVHVVLVAEEAAAGASWSSARPCLSGGSWPALAPTPPASRRA